MIFAGIVKTSLVDFPGKIATVLFTPGCNYNCFYCHNRNLIEDIKEIIPNEEIETFLEKRRGLIDGVVITGGEPTLHKDLLPYFAKLKSMGYKTKLDTNGSNPGVVEMLLSSGNVDYYAIDYKAPKARYREIARGDGDGNVVLKTINILLDSGADFEVRTTVIPQLSLEDLVVMAKELPQVPRYVLNPYHKPLDFLETDRELVEVPAYPENEIAGFAETLKLYQPNVVLVF